MKTVCIYHSIDLDGWMSAAIVKHWFIKRYGNNCSITGVQNLNELPKTKSSFTPENQLVLIGYNYGQPIPDLSSYDQVIMCDISFPKEIMLKLQLEDKKLMIWLDHHISAINDLKEDIERGAYIEGIRDTKFAACELTWKYFMSNPIEKFGEVEDQNPIPEIVRLLGRYDCFGHKGTDEEQTVLEFQYGARQCISNYEDAYRYLIQDIPYTKEINVYVSPIVSDIIVKGKSIYQYLCTEAKQSYKNGFEIQFTLPSKTSYYDNRTPVKFICINKERFNPINFGIDYHKDGYDGAACFHYDGETKLWKFSLYNDNGQVDCSMIAKLYDGGGHKGAAGFTIKNLNEIIN